MKKENFQRLQFNKQSITELNLKQMGNIYGGTRFEPTLPAEGPQSIRTVTTGNSSNCTTSE